MDVEHCWARRRGKDNGRDAAARSSRGLGVSTAAEVVQVGFAFSPQFANEENVVV